MFHRWFGKGKKHPLERGEHLTERSRRVLALSQESAEHMNSKVFRSEHILLGMMREEGSIAKYVVVQLGAQVDTIEQAIIAISPPPLASQSSVDSIVALAPEVQELFDLALVAARQMGNPFIGTEHLLLSLIRQHNSTAVRALEQVGITPYTVQSEVRQILVEAARKTSHSDKMGNQKS